MHTYPIQALLSAAAAGVLSRSSGGDTVEWKAPAAGDVYGPGETLVGQWEATKDVVSPSFTLCDSGESGCGSAVWPEVKGKDGSYSISLVLPNVTEEATYHLQMKDDFGKTFNSPKFSLSPSPQPAAEDTADEQTSSSSGTEMGASSDPDSSPTTPPATSSSDEPSGSSQVVPVVDPNQAQVPVSAPSSPSSPSTPSSPPSSPPYAAAQPSTGPSRASMHNGPPTAAVAIPLSLTGAILLVAGALALHHKRSLAREQAQDAVLRAETMKDGKAVLEALSRRTTVFEGDAASLHMGSGGTLGADVEKALLIRALLAEKQGGPGLPSPYAAYAPQHPHLAHYMSPSLTPVSAPAPVPRQRTRELYAPPSPIGHQARPRAVTRAISDADSTTSSVLSAYLPSPTDYASHPEPSSPPHDRELEPAFDEVLLSPRIPPALHVRVPAPASATPLGLDREKALPPSPGTARVYDKVARALGIGHAL